MSQLTVELVAADQKVWEGEATMVSVRASDGDLGVLPGHAPLMCMLAEGEVRIDVAGGQRETVDVDSGFMTVEDNRVTIACHKVKASTLS